MENGQGNFNTGFFDWAKLLEDNWLDIKEELNTLLSYPEKLPNKTRWFLAHPHYVDSQNERAWKTYEFVFFGMKQIPHCENCPKTYDLLKQIPDLVTAQFSILEPKTRVNAHKGFTRMVLRNHLALKIPSQELCKIKVEDEEASWTEGKVITFDDSKIHEAWNMSDETRIVLMIDVANPDFPYSADQICRYKIENIDDPFLLNIANKETWLKWYEAGELPNESLNK